MPRKRGRERETNPVFTSCSISSCIAGSGGPAQVAGHLPAPAALAQGLLEQWWPCQSLAVREVSVLGCAWVNPGGAAARMCSRLPQDHEGSGARGTGTASEEEGSMSATSCSGEPKQVENHCDQATCSSGCPWAGSVVPAWLSVQPQGWGVTAAALHPRSAVFPQTWTHTCQSTWA